MSDTKTPNITDKEYREIYSNMSKERLIELLIADKRELRRLRGMWLEQKQANEANKQPDTEALRLQNVMPSALDDKLKAERISLMRDLISDFEGGWDCDEYVRMLEERIDIEINGI